MTNTCNSANTDTIQIKKWFFDNFCGKGVVETSEVFYTLSSTTNLRGFGDNFVLISTKIVKEPKKSKTSVHLQSLKLFNFKNYETQELELSPRINCFVGENGMGKTNLLDALHYLCMCKSYFGLTDAQVIRQSQDFFRIEGVFQRKDRRENIICKYAMRSRKVLERNKVPYTRLSEHIGLLPMVIISPDDHILITEGSEYRRQYLDILLVQLDTTYLNHLMVYNKVLEQRNAFLKQYRHPSEVEYALLHIYNEQLEAPAQYIFEKRQAVIQKLSPIFQAYYKTISGDKEQVQIQYESPLQDSPMTAVLLENEERDIYLQRTSKGIHKDDLKLFINDFVVKKFASQGQLKSYLLALKLAQYELLRQESEVTPLVLLDDIFDKLDKKRVQQLLQLLLEREFGQIFITDTDAQRVAELGKMLGVEVKLFEVVNGVAAEIDK